MTFHSFIAFLMSEINPWLPENEGVCDHIHLVDQRARVMLSLKNIPIWGAVL